GKPSVLARWTVRVTAGPRCSRPGGRASLQAKLARTAAALAVTLAPRGSLSSSAVTHQRNPSAPSKLRPSPALTRTPSEGCANVTAYSADKRGPRPQRSKLGAVTGASASAETDAGLGVGSAGAGSTASSGLDSPAPKPRKYRSNTNAITSAIVRHESPSIGRSRRSSTSPCGLNSSSRTKSLGLPAGA